MYTTQVYITNLNVATLYIDCKAQQATRCQADNQAQSHEAACSFALAGIDPAARGRHETRAQPAVCETKRQLYYEEVEKVARHYGAVAPDVAQEVERDLHDAQSRKEEESEGLASDRIPCGCEYPAAEIAQVPEKEG